MAEELDPQIAASIERGGVDLKAKDEEETGPLYRVMGDSKIAVPKHMGKVWSSRRDQAKAVRCDVETAWTEAIRYYENDQIQHRDGQDGASGNGRYARTIGDNWSATENVVFANICTMLPLLYAKNPNVEVSVANSANEQLGKCAEAVIDFLFSTNNAPGINLKTKVRRGIFYTALMNTAYSRVGWTKKQDSSEEALTQLQQLSEKYANAKTAKESKEIEGQIQALEEKISLLTPSGPTFKVISAFRIYVDSASVEPDHSDAQYMMEYDFLPTAYINAVYGKKVEKGVVSVYEPTHLLKSGNEEQGVQDDVNNFTLFNKDAEAEAKASGYRDGVAFKNAQYTKVWYIWDKVTRRLFLYADNNWTWPLWVWDDPLKLLEFYPYDRLWFHEGFEAAQSKGEVTYYLDQQDTINDINSTIKQARDWTKNNVFYDKNAISQSDVEAVLNGPDGTAKGIDLPEGKTMKDVLYSVPPPALAFPDLLNTGSSFEAINRITGINDAQRGAQFKTNTTNDAVNAYQKNVDIRVDEKIDMIEDWIGKFAWKILQIAMREWSTEDVVKLIGPELGQHWKQITDPNELRTTLSLRVVGGSTDKPTSKTKQEMALKVGGLLGQFANAIPYCGIVALKVFERAFDEVVILPEDWTKIFQSMEDQQNKAGAGPNGEGGGGQGQEPNPEQLKELIMRLPEPAKAALEQLIQQGASPTDALKQVMAQMQAQSEQQTSTQQ